MIIVINISIILLVYIYTCLDRRRKNVAIYDILFCNRHVLLFYSESEFVFHLYMYTEKKKKNHTQHTIGYGCGCYDRRVMAGRYMPAAGLYHRITVRSVYTI